MGLEKLYYTQFCSTDLCICFFSNATPFDHFVVYLEVGITMSSALLLLHKVTFAILSLLCFYMTFRIALSRSVKHAVGILIGTALNLFNSDGHFNNIDSTYPGIGNIFPFANCLFQPPFPEYGTLFSWDSAWNKKDCFVCFSGNRSSFACWVAYDFDPCAYGTRAEGVKGLLPHQHWQRGLQEARSVRQRHPLSWALMRLRPCRPQSVSPLWCWNGVVEVEWIIRKWFSMTWKTVTVFLPSFLVFGFGFFCRKPVGNLKKCHVLVFRTNNWVVWETLVF